MKQDIIWTCNVCNRIPSNQSLRKCPICGRKLTAWDRSKDPIERKPEWPVKKREEKKNSDDNYVDYTQFLSKEKT